MKKSISISSLLLWISFCYGQPQWAEAGTRWWYHTTNYYAYEMTEEYTVTGQATIGGQLCQVVESPSDTIYTYESSGQVYYWNQEDSAFYLRYDWTKVTTETYYSYINGDSLMCEVTGEDSIEIAGIFYPTQYIFITIPGQPDLFAQEQVILNLGSLHSYIMPVPTDVIVELWTFLTCYESEDTGLQTVHAFPDVSCESLALPTSEIKGQNIDLTVYPNPARDQVQVYFFEPVPARTKLRMLTVHGVELLEHDIASGTTNVSLDLAGFSAGLYYMVLEMDGLVLQGKKLVMIK